MSMYSEPDPQPIEDSPQFKAAVEAAYQQRLAADLAKHGVKPQVPEEQVRAELLAAASGEEVEAVLRKYGRAG